MSLKGINMAKKFASFFIILSLCLALVSCSSEGQASSTTTTETEPQRLPITVIYKGETYTINEQAPSDEFSTDNSMIKAQAGSANGNDFIYVPGENGEIRCIRIKTADVDVYGDIKVGDDASKIEEVFENVMVREGVAIYYVFFDGTENIDYMSDEYADHNLLEEPFGVICYSISNDKVSAILVADELFIMQSK